MTTTDTESARPAPPRPTPPRDTRRSDSSRPPRRRWRRVRRVMVAAALVTALALIGVILLMTQTPVISNRVLPRLAEALNLDVQADSVYIAWDGQLVLSRARFRLPDVAGPAGEFLTVKTVRIGINWWSLMGSEPDIRGVLMVEPVLTISQSLEDRSLNIGRLILPAPPAREEGSESAGEDWPGSTFVIPAVVATGARLELGEHEDDRYTPLNSIMIYGRFSPAPPGAEASAYEFSLAETAPGGEAAGEGEARGLRVNGTYTPNRIALTVENISLDRWPAETIPSPVRGLFRDLHLEGNVPAASFTYTEEEGITARLDLRGVGMNLPIEPELTPPSELPPDAAVVYGPPPRFMRLYDTEGTITFARESVIAQVHGRLEDMPYRVSWFHQGTSPNSPFTCDFVSENFRLDRAPALLPYAPPVVRERLRDFSSPTATVSTRMTIRRGEPLGNRPGLITVSGQADLREGVAAFQGFPYEVHNISGTFRFSNDKIELQGITGRSRSGAHVEAEGLIAPLDDDAQVDVSIRVRGAPIDDAMIDAFGEHQRDLVPALFNRDAYQQLIAAGLVRSSATALREATELSDLRTASGAARDPQAQERIEELTARAAVPVFDLAGAADIHVNVHRPYGEETPWQTTIDIRLPDAGLLAEVFPYPIVARNLTAHIDNNEGRITGGTFHGLTGARAEVAATFTIPLIGSDPPRPDITITASEVPVDRLLVNALPGDDAAEHKRLLRDLRLSGTGTGTVRIINRPAAAGAEPKVGVDVDARIRSARIVPDAAVPEAAMAVGDLDIRALASEKAMSLEFAGTPRSTVRDGTAEGRISGTLRAEFRARGDSGAAAYAGTVAWPDLPADSPVETLVRPFSTEVAEQIATARGEHRPTGRISATVEFEVLEDEPRIDVRLSDARDLALDVLDGRAELGASSGAISISTWPDPLATFEKFEAPLNYGGSPSGELHLNGQWPLEGRKELRAAAPLTIGVRGVDIESALVDDLLRSHVAAATLERVRPYNVRGMIDAGLALAPGNDGPEWRTLHVRPRHITFDVDGTTIELAGMGGMIEIEPRGSGLLRRFAAAAPDWSIVADAAWSRRPDESLAIQSEFALSGGRLSPDLRALLPQEVRSVLDDLAIEVDGPFELNEGKLRLMQNKDGRTESIDFAADLRFRDAALDAGVQLSQVTGRSLARFERAAADAAPEFRFDVRADTFTAAGISMNDGFATITSGAKAGEVLVSNAVAEAHEGRIAATARVAPMSAGAQEQPPGAGATAGAAQESARSYTASVQLSGVRFSPLLSELLDDAVDPSEPWHVPLLPMSLEGVGDGVVDAPVTGDISRGMVDAELSLSGMVGDPLARRGRGAIRISGGRVMSLPGVLTLIEVSTLQLPVNARLDYASADFYIDGGIIFFSDLSAYSRSLEILGQGTMTWPEQILNMRFDTRSSRPIPVLSHIVKGIRDELITTTVRGKLGQHEVRLQQLPRSRRMLGLGPPRSLTPSEREEDLRERSRSEADIRERGGSFGPGIAPTRPGD